MSTRAFIESQALERQPLLAAIHKIILQEDISVVETVSMMMGKEMISYKFREFFKYGLASGKSYMTLHLMPMYVSEKIILKYRPLLPKAIFQKGCINFKTEEEMPVDIVRKMIVDCTNVDMEAIKKLSLML